MPIQDPWRKQRTCPVCGDPFMPVREHQVYDSTKCRVLAFRERQRERMEDEIRAAIEAQQRGVRARAAGVKR